MQQTAGEGRASLNGSPGAGVTSRANSLARWLVHLFIVLLCVAPSVWINVKAQLELGSGYDMVAAVIGFAVLAPILTLNSAESMRACRWLLASFWGLLAAVFIILNTVLALGGYSAVRDSVMDARAAKMRQSENRTERLKDARNQIADLRKVAGTASPEMLAHEVASMEANRIFARSAQCSSVTLPDSQAFCQRLASERRKKAAADEIRRIEELIERKGWAVSTATEAPSTADPQIENLTALTVAFFGVRYDQRLMAAMLSVFLALMTEILADLGPIAVLFAARSLRKKSADPTPHHGQDEEQDKGAIMPVLPVMAEAAQDEPKALENKADPAIIMDRTAGQDEQDKAASILPPDGLDPASLEDVKSWLESCLDPDQDGERIAYGDAHKHLAEWCKARRKKVVPKSAFTLAMKSLGWPDDAAEGATRYRAKVGGKMWFYGVAIKSKPTLRAVK